MVFAVVLSVVSVVLAWYLGRGGSADDRCLQGDGPLHGGQLRDGAQDDERAAGGGRPPSHLNIRRQSPGHEGVRGLRGRNQGGDVQGPTSGGRGAPCPRGGGRRVRQVGGMEARVLRSRAPVESVLGLQVLMPGGGGPRDRGLQDDVGHRHRHRGGPPRRQAAFERGEGRRHRRPSPHREVQEPLPGGHGHAGGHVPFRRGSDQRRRGDDGAQDVRGPARRHGLELRSGGGRGEAPRDTDVQRPLRRGQHGPGLPREAHG